MLSRKFISLLNEYSGSQEVPCLKGTDQVAIFQATNFQNDEH